MKLCLAALVVAFACGGSNHQTFDPDTQYQVMVRVVGPGYVEVDGRQRCNIGETCEYSYAHSNLGNVPPARLTATPGADGVFVEWTGDCTGTAPTVEVSAPPGTILSCTATFEQMTPQPPGGRFATLTKPEGIDLFHIGPNRPAGAPLLVAPGLASGTYVAVAGGDTAGGLDLIKLADGTRKTNQFVDISPAYGVTAYQAPNGPRWMVFGAQGTATAGWNDSAMDFGGTGLGIAQNTTQVAVADFNDDGTAEKIMVTAPSNMIYVYAPDGTGSTIIDGTAFTGTAGQAVSGQFGRTVDEALIVLVDGRVFFGPVAGAAGRLTLVGTAGTSPRLMHCAGTTPRICAIADYSGDKIHVVEIDGTGAHLTASLATGDAPIDPAIVMDGAIARIAVTGSGDDTLEVMTYDPATDALAVAVQRSALVDCDQPNHVVWSKSGSSFNAIIACYGSNVILAMGG